MHLTNDLSSRNRFTRAKASALPLALFAVTLLSMGVAEAQDRSAASNKPIAFDLPSQPLVAALEHYSVISWNWPRRSRSSSIIQRTIASISDWRS